MIIVTASLATWRVIRWLVVVSPLTTPMIAKRIVAIEPPVYFRDIPSSLVISPPIHQVSLYFIRDVILDIVRELVSRVDLDFRSVISSDSRRISSWSFVEAPSSSAPTSKVTSSSASACAMTSFSASGTSPGPRTELADSPSGYLPGFATWVLSVNGIPIVC